MPKAIRTERLGDALNYETISLVRSQGDAADSGSIAQAVIDLGLEIASERVTNGLKEAGLSVDGTLSAESIRQTLSAKLGAEIPELSAEGIAQALNASISYQVGELIGVEGLDIVNGGDIVDQAKQIAIESIRSGRASKLVSARLMRQLKDAAALAAGGLNAAEREKYMARARHRRFRRTSKLVWEK